MKEDKVVVANLDADIPVMAHLGLTPQSVHFLGGFRVQGKLKQKAQEIIDDARSLEDMGAFSLVLESVPMELAQRVTEMLSIPVIGIGAGKYCDGQILVYHDLLGFTDVYLPKFVRKYADIYSQSLSGLKQYVADVQKGTFPDDRESYHLKKDLDEFLK